MPPLLRSLLAQMGKNVDAGLRPELWAAGMPPLLRSLLAQMGKNVDAGLRPELWAAGMPPLLRRPFMLSAPLFFNMENRLFSRACALARKYAKIRNV